jgi:Ca-activated chloride channel family protein
MTRAWCTGLAGAVAVGLTAAAQQPQPAQTPPQGPAFRAGVELVSLNVTVSDPSSRYVTGIEQDEFNVFEDGVKQDVTFFSRTQLPVAMAILLDTSASMEERLKTAQDAAIGFADRLRSQDVAEIIDFDSRVEILQAFTNDRSLLSRAIQQTAAGGSTSLYNAIYISLKELKKVQAQTVDEIRRQAIVLLSDGEDTSSLVSFEEVMELAKRSETAIYAVGLRSREPGAARGFKEAEFVLRQLSQETGGRAFFLNSITELGAIYQQISDELSSQYTLGYTPKNPRRDGGWRRVVVRVNRPNTTARTKQGYYGPTSH